MQAVLEDAIGILGVSPRLKITNADVIEVRTWVDDDDDDWVFSFRNACEALNISPAMLREKLHKAYPRAWKLIDEPSPPRERITDDGKVAIVKMLSDTLLPLQAIADALNFSAATVHAVGRATFGPTFLKRRRRMVKYPNAPHPGEPVNHCALCSSYCDQIRRRLKKFPKGAVRQ
jgi:hypothetical protein